MDFLVSEDGRQDHISAMISSKCMEKNDRPFSTASGCELNREKDNLYSQIIDLQKAEQAEMRRHMTKYGQTDHPLFIIGIGRLR